MKATVDQLERFQALAKDIGLDVEDTLVEALQLEIGGATIRQEWPEDGDITISISETTQGA